MLKKKVREYYHEAVVLHPKASSELKRTLKSNERVPAFIDNLVVQIERAQEQRLKNGKKVFSDKVIKELVYDFANIFIIGIEEQAKRNYESDLARIARQDAESYRHALDKASKGGITDSLKELGIKSSEVTDG